MNSTAQIEVVVAKTLDELGKRARRECALVAESLNSALSHAIAAGEALYEAHAQIEAKSTWGEWLRSEVGIAPSHAGKYERLYFYRAHIPAEAFRPHQGQDGRLLQPSLGRAEIYLRGLPQIRPDRGGFKTPDPELVSEARRMVDAGVEVSYVAVLLGKSDATIKRWTNDTYRRQLAAASKRNRHQRRTAARMLAREKDAAAIRKHAGGLSEVYASTRKSLLILQRELDEHEDRPRIRREINGLISDLHKVEDRVVAVLKQSRASD